MKPTKHNPNMETNINQKKKPFCSLRMRRGSKEKTTYKRETDENRLNIDINEDLSTSPGTSTNQLLGTVSNTNDMFAVLHTSYFILSR